MGRAGVKKKKIVRMKLAVGGPSGKRLMPFKKKRVRKHPPQDPANMPATKGDIQQLMEIADWPPAMTRDPYGVRMKQAYNQLSALFNSNANDFRAKFCEIAHRLKFNGDKYRENLKNSMASDAQSTTSQPQAPPPQTTETTQTMTKKQRAAANRERRAAEKAAAKKAKQQTETEKEDKRRQKQGKTKRQGIRSGDDLSLPFVKTNKSFYK